MWKRPVAPAQETCELREPESFIMGSKYACLWLWRETQYLSSKSVQYTNILGKVVCNKGSQRLCSQDVWKYKHPIENLSNDPQKEIGGSWWESEVMFVCLFTYFPPSLGDGLSLVVSLNRRSLLLSRWPSFHNLLQSSSHYALSFFQSGDGDSSSFALPRLTALSRHGPSYPVHFFVNSFFLDKLFMVCPTWSVPSVSC